MFFYTFQGGNLTEEYSQPFISAAIYLFIKYAVQSEKTAKHPPVYAFAYGIMLAILAFIRLNNAITICAGVLAIFIFLIYKKEYINLLCNVLAGLAGVALVAIPICMFFCYKSALNEMLYATFLYNFNIVGNTGQRSFFEQLPMFFVLLPPIIICYLLLGMHVYKKRSLCFVDCLLGCILLCNTLVLYLANRYPHYFAIFVPVYVVFLFRYSKMGKNVAVVLIALCTAVNLWNVGYSIAATAYSCYISGNARAPHNAVQDVVNIIPESERNLVIGFHIPVSYYVYGDIMPCYKYYTWQSSWATINPQIMVDFIEWVGSEKPTWILVTPEETNPEMIQILHNQYIKQAGNEFIAAYRLVENE